MTDIAAVMGLCGLADFSRILNIAKIFLCAYHKGLSEANGIKLIGW